MRTEQAFPSHIITTISATLRYKVLCLSFQNTLMEVAVHLAIICLQYSHRWTRPMQELRNNQNNPPPNPHLKNHYQSYFRLNNKSIVFLLAILSKKPENQKGNDCFCFTAPEQRGLYISLPNEMSSWNILQLVACRHASITKASSFKYT